MSTVPADAMADRPERFTGTDDTGAVSVVVDRRGMVADVVIAANWRERLHPRELGLAMCTAANEALSDRLADEIEHLDFEPEFRPVPRHDARDAGGDPASVVARELQAEVAELLVAYDRDVVTYQRELSEAVNATATARSRNGAVEVTMGHGRVVTVTIDPTWAKSAKDTHVRADTLAAFTAAGERLSTADPSAVTPPAAIARLTRLAKDPSALMKELGLW